MAKQIYLDFEQPLAELQSKIDELTELHHGVDQLDVSDELKKLTKKLADLNKAIYSKLNPWQVAQVARHAQRPYTLDYANGLFTEFVDSVMAELLIESLKRMANRHAVIFVTMQDPTMVRMTEAEPDNFDTIARAVVAHDFLRERAIVLERIARLGVHCLDVPVGGMTIGLLNRYLEIKQKGLL